MKLETRYSVGEKVLVMADIKTRIKCPFCNGKNFLLINNEQIYCQNCDDGELVFRSNERVQTIGTIKGLMYDIRTENIDDIDEISEYEDFVKVDGNITHQVEYYIDVDDNKFYGNGTYRENQILGKA